MSDYPSTSSIIVKINEEHVLYMQYWKLSTDY